MLFIALKYMKNAITKVVSQLFILKKNDTKRNDLCISVTKMMSIVKKELYIL